MGVLDQMIDATHDSRPIQHVAFPVSSGQFEMNYSETTSRRLDQSIGNSTDAVLRVCEGSGNGHEGTAQTGSVCCPMHPGTAQSTMCCSAVSGADASADEVVCCMSASGRAICSSPSQDSELPPEVLAKRMQSSDAIFVFGFFCIAMSIVMLRRMCNRREDGIEKPNDEGMQQEGMPMLQMAEAEHSP